MRAGRHVCIRNERQPDCAYPSLTAHFATVLNSLVVAFSLAPRRLYAYSRLCAGGHACRLPVAFTPQLVSALAKARLRDAELDNALTAPSNEDPAAAEEVGAGAAGSTGENAFFRAIGAYEDALVAAGRKAAALDALTVKGGGLVEQERKDLENIRGFLVSAPRRRRSGHRADKRRRFRTRKTHALRPPSCWAMIVEGRDDFYLEL